MNLILIDVSAYVYRYYFATPPMQRPSDGQHLNAVFGYCGVMQRLMEQRQHQFTHIAAVFDYGRSEKRNAIYPEYKAQRTPSPVELTSQFAFVRQATEAFGVPIAQCRGYEADDLIATYAKHASSTGLRTTILSSDKDMMQLVDETVSIHCPMKDKHKGIADVREFFGVDPHQVIDVQAIMGDASDNIPGVHGIGIKGAGALVAEFGNLEGLFANLPKMANAKTRYKLQAHKDQCFMSRELARLDVNVPVDVPVDDLAVRAVDRDALAEFYGEMGFHSLARGMREAA